MNTLTKTIAGMALATTALVGAERAFADGGELHLYNWTDYTSDDMIKKFEKETGIKVTIDTYDSNETALAKIKSGAAGYDVMIISNDFVPIFVKQGLFEKVDAGKMPNFKNVDLPKAKCPADTNILRVSFAWNKVSDDKMARRTAAGEQHHNVSMAR